MDTHETKSFPLLPFSSLVNEDVAKGKGDAWYFDYELRAEAVDAQRLRHAVELALLHHPVFSCRISDSRQHYESGYRTPFFTYSITEAGCTCILTIRIHRILGDGASMMLFLRTVNKLYQGEAVPPDTYLEHLEDNERYRLSAQYTSSRQWLEQHFDDVTAPSCPHPDIECSAAFASARASEGVVTLPGISIKDSKYGKGSLLNLATALAIMDYNGTDSAALTWGYLGRDTLAEQTIFGSLSRDIPFFITRNSSDTIASLKAKARTEVEQGIMHSAYPYTFNASNRELWLHSVNVGIIPDVDLTIGDTLWQLISPDSAKPKEAHCFLDVEYHEGEGMLLIRYADTFYTRESIIRFASLIEKNLCSLQGQSPRLPLKRQEPPTSGSSFMERFEENMRMYPDKVILQDSETRITFAELDELSGRIYAYLKAKGIGREDFVMIYLPRGVKCIVAMLGVWKACAALVICDLWEAAERIRYKYDECHCKLSISSENWAEITSTPSRHDYIHADIHDAAYALYTSGSEGLPKGVIHEYGNLEYASNCVFADNVAVYQHEDRVAHPLPMSSTGGLIHALSPLRCGAYVEFLPLGMLGDIEKLEHHLVDERITVTGLVPSMIGERKIKSPFIKIFLTGSEMTSNVFMEDYPILNMYGQTETSMNPLNFVIDRMYRNTPVGSRAAHPSVLLLDDDSMPVSTGEKGEICVPYHYSRGYINDPKLTAATFCDGLFHTGDIARVNEDGNYVILGRKTDMIKINGNRIEPAEIETAVKRVLNIDWAFAKGFVQPERSFICVYYTANIDIDMTLLREELFRILPAYMIPSYFIHVDTIPRLPNGKIDRQAFIAPDVKDYVGEYVAPANELEDRICQAMQEVLGLKRISATDDFYLLGGDSLRTIKLVTSLSVNGISVQDIYAARTPRAIATRCKNI